MTRDVCATPEDSMEMPDRDRTDDRGPGGGDRRLRPLVATYRLQVRDGTDLADAEALLPYLVSLGVSHLYLSPVLQANEGSTHGYDVVDPGRVDDALGGDDAFDALADRAHQLGLGVVLDIVPNHMAADSDRNRWWRDVLRNGRASERAGHFDVTWDPPDRKLANRILLPVLGHHYGRVLEEGELVLEREDDELRVRYFDRTFPLDPRSTAVILHDAAEQAGSPALALIARTLGAIVDPTDPDADQASFVRRRADLAAAMPVLRQLVEDPAVAAALDRAVQAVAADPAALHEVLEQQSYRLARWQTGSQEIDYRRFFDVSELVGVRVEDRAVFDDVHSAVARWIGEGRLDGLRVDHPDGLADPAGYFQELRDLAGGAWIVVEKILETGEQLPPWPVDGTTGYEFAAAVNRIFVAPEGHAEIRRATAELLGIDGDFETAVREAKLDALHNELAAELRRLTDSLVAVCERHPRFRDFTRAELSDVLSQCLASLPVYRTYVTAQAQASDQDREVLEVMAARVDALRPDIDDDLLHLVRHSILGDGEFDDGAATRFRQRFQQLSGAVMAKGKEDTALYRYPVLLSTNEVGADPAHPTASLDELHAVMEAMAEQHPEAMLTLSTHDTKRSEDVRARLDVLSEVPERYLDLLQRVVDRCSDRPGVDTLALVIVLQTLIGATPISEERLQAYLEKALREARRHTSWLDPQEAYETEVRELARDLTTDPTTRQEIDQLISEVLVDGRVNSLAQRLLLLAAPGVPDLYQGSELWDLSLVDPDNRRRVDFDERSASLAETRASDLTAALPSIDDLGDDADPGAAKLALTARTLAVRRAHPDAFGPAGGYRPVRADGDGADHLFAFVRGDDVLVAVPRLGRTLRDRHGGWGATTLPLPAGEWADALHPERRWAGSVPADELLATFPVALLRRVAP